MSDLPLVFFTDLQVSPDALQGTDHLIGVVGNTSTVRVPVNTFTANFVKASSAPAATSSSGESNTISATGSGFFAHAGAWGKVPIYYSNWDDLDSDSRFLLVSSVMNLTATELSNVLTTLNIQQATTDTPGLVKLSETITLDEQNALAVRHATPIDPGIVRLAVPDGTLDADIPNMRAASTAYVDDMLEQRTAYVLPTASATVKGGVLIGDNIQVTDQGMISVEHADIRSGGQGTEYIYGVVQVAPDELGDNDLTEHNTKVTTVPRVQNMIDAALDTSIPVATTTQTGTVIPGAYLTIADDTTGLINVNVADVGTPDSNGVYSGATAGVVMPRANLLETGLVPTNNDFPTSKAVVDYVTQAGAQSTIIPSDRLPVATATTLGAIKSSDSLLVNAATGLAYVRQASRSSPGIVTTVPGINNDSAPTSVPTLKRTNELINDAVAGVVDTAIEAMQNTKASEAIYGVVNITPAENETSATWSTVPSTLYIQNYVSNILGPVVDGQGNLTVSGSSTFTGAATFNGGAVMPVNATQDYSVCNRLSSTGTAAICEAYQYDEYIQSTTALSNITVANAVRPGEKTLTVAASSVGKATLNYTNAFRYANAPSFIGGIMSTFALTSPDPYAKICWVIGNAARVTRLTTSDADDLMASIGSAYTGYAVIRLVELTLYARGAAFTDIVGTTDYPVRVREIWGDTAAQKWKITTTISKFDYSSLNLVNGISKLAWQWETRTNMGTGGLWFIAPGCWDTEGNNCARIANLHSSSTTGGMSQTTVYLEASRNTAAVLALTQGSIRGCYLPPTFSSNPNYYAFSSIENSKILSETTEDLTVFSN